MLYFTKSSSQPYAVGAIVIPIHGYGNRFEKLSDLPNVMQFVSDGEMIWVLTT